MTNTIEEWSAKEADRIVRLTRSMPEDMQAEYLAQKMLEALCRRIEALEDD